MRGTTDTFWRPFGVDVYLDARQPAWAEAERQWARYAAIGTGRGRRATSPTNQGKG
jgi:hypothetical protein